MIRPLVETASNPLPPGTRVEPLNLADGKELRYAITPATRHPVQGTVLILQGRNECIEKYFETARDIAARGFTVATFDWRGQGASSRLLPDPARGYVKSFDDYAADLEQLFESVLLPDCRGPYYILGHSTGALVALLAAPALSNRVRRMVLTAPLLDITGSRARKIAARFGANALRSAGLGKAYMLGGPHAIKAFAMNEVTSDTARYQRNCEILEQAPELAIGGPTASWIVAAAAAIKKVSRPDFIDMIRIPMLVIAAGMDSVVSTPAIERYALQLRNTTLLTVDGAKHEILQEKDFYRQQFFAAFDAFIPGTGGESL
ncbi:alpha/beta fold hydrolase [Phyllobacterium lublinensis]|uniref:alpha/beta fold hydrolase n=1 Tax=Phyllobacterium lublinensis TaxID=2875708 RepID=UPI001CC99336|nr:alpha/beta hydrolase [Phyllobacterium sp. 2063]MBZ9655824.1 alpha/beta hydrolase [Phyllobacterium sp. 2063]